MKCFTKSAIPGQLCRYLFAGGLVLSTDYGLLLLMAGPLHFFYLVATGIAFVLGESLSFYISLRWVFEVESKLSRASLFLMFQIAGVVGLLLTLGGVYILSDNLLVSQAREWVSAFTGIAIPFYLLPKAVTTVVVFFWNFMAKRWVLSGHPERLVRWFREREARVSRSNR
jgi:putative flippase GtrA